MSALENGIKELRRIHKKYGIEGSLENISHVALKWQERLPRSFETDYLFKSCDPVNVEFETGLTPICFFGLSTLERGQIGYRWMGESDKTQLSGSWPLQYLVFMDDIGGGKPVIAVTDVPGTPILASYDAIEPFMIANSLSDFLLAFAKTIEIVHGEFEIFDIYDEDDELSSKFVKLLTREVAPILGEENFQRFFDYFYG